MEKRRDQKKGAWALLLSLFVHVALLLWGVYGRSSAPERFDASRPIEIEIVRIEPPKPPEPERTAAPPAQPPVRPERSRASAASRGGVERAPQHKPIEAVVQPGPVAGEQGAPAKTADATARDVPRTVTLQPSLGVVLPGLGTGERELSKGRTVVNGPGEEPDAVALREYTEETIERRLNEDLANGAAAARARNGLLDPYFTKLGSKLNEGLGKAGVQLRERKAGEILREEVFGTWQGIAESYGKNGNPLNSEDQERRVVESGLGRQADQGRVNGISGGDVNGQREMSKAMQQFGAMEAFVAAAQRPRLRTVIELRQDRDGALAEAVFLERSGDDKFDEFALHQARKVVREQGEVEDPDQQPYKEGWRSVWAFTWEPPKVKAKLLRVLRGQPPHPVLLPRP